MSDDMFGAEDFFGPVISSYTRQQAIEDGFLVDVTMQAAEVGFSVHTVLTVNAWCEAVKCTPKQVEAGQSERGRLHDVLFLARICVARIPEGDRVEFDVLVSGRTVHLICHIGPGDEGEPVITIMLPSDD